MLLTAANCPDGSVFEALIDSIRPIKRPRGRPRKRPDKVHADKAYDSPRCRSALRKRGIKVRIARKGVESSTRLGRHRWVVERTLSWLGKYRLRRAGISPDAGFLSGATAECAGAPINRALSLASVDWSKPRRSPATYDTVPTLDGRLPLVYGLCPICHHSQRASIDERLRTGRELRPVADEFGMRVTVTSTWPAWLKAIAPHRGRTEPGGRGGTGWSLLPVSRAPIR